MVRSRRFDFRPRFRLGGAWVPMMRVLLLGVFATPLAAQDPQFTLTAPDAIWNPGATVEHTVILDSEAALTGWSYAVCHEPGDVTLLAVDPSEEIATADDGELPMFYSVALLPEGYTVGAVFISSFGGSLPAGTIPMSTATYENLLPEGGTTTITPCELELTLLAVAIQSFTTTDVNFPIDPVAGTIQSIERVPFIRGDVNQDGAIDLGDPIASLPWFFLIAAPNPCLAALDANGDDSSNIADTVYLLNYLFLMGDPPPAPFPACGVTDTQLPIDCVSFNGCP